MGKDRHRYRTCRDEDCPRLACIAYKDGRDDEAEAQRAEAQQAAAADE